MRMVSKKDAPDARKSKVHERMEATAKAIVRTIEHGYKKDERADWEMIPLPVMNCVTRHRYAGGNRWYLTHLCDCEDWGDPRFVTYKQCASMLDETGSPAHIRKGEKAAEILLPLQFDKKIELTGDDDGKYETIIEEDGKRYAVIKMVTYKVISVFNLAQTTAAAPPLPGLSPRDWLDSDFFEAFVKASGITVKNDHPSRAYFSLTHNSIHLPSKDAFASPGQYYATLMHEFFHATGHASRMNRFSSASPEAKENYAIEELRAELFSAACVRLFGLKYPREKNVSYIESWTQAVSGEKTKAILKAANEAEVILEAILDAAEGKQPKLNWFPKIDFSAFPTPLKERMTALKAENPLEHETATQDERESDAQDNDDAPGFSMSM